MPLCPSCHNQLTLISKPNASRMTCVQCNFSVFVQDPTPNWGSAEEVAPSETAPSETAPIEPEAKEEPSLIQKAANLGKAVINHARDGFRKCSPTEYVARLDICKQCDRLVKDETKETTGMCIECGCPVSAKARWASEACPIGKWGISTQSQGGCGSCGKNR